MYKSGTLKKTIVVAAAAGFVITTSFGTVSAGQVYNDSTVGVSSALDRYINHITENNDGSYADATATDAKTVVVKTQSTKAAGDKAAQKTEKTTDKKNTTKKKTNTKTDNKTTDSKQAKKADTAEKEDKIKYPEFEGKCIAISTDYVNIRSEAGTDSDVIGIIGSNGVATVEEKGSEWTKVVSGDCEGYIRNDLLVYGDDAGEYAEANCSKKATVSTDTLNVREDADADSDCVTQVGMGQTFDILSQNDGWIQIALDDSTSGYVSADYIDYTYDLDTAKSMEQVQEEIASQQTADSQEDSQDTTDDQTTDGSEDTADDQTADGSEDAADDQTADGSQDTVDDQTADDGEDTVDDQTADGSEDAADDQTADGSQDATDDQTADDSQDASDDQTADDSQDASDDQTADDSEDTTDDQTADDSEDTADDQTADDSENTADDQTADDSEDAADDQTTDDSQDAADDQTADAAAPSGQTGVDLANYATQFVGNPYVYGGSSLTDGADCSGFVMAVYAQFGYSLPHSAGMQSDYGTRVDTSSLEPGDILFYGDGSIEHCAIYIGDGMIVHASTEETGIKISSAFYRDPMCAVRLIGQ